MGSGFVVRFFDRLFKIPLLRKTIWTLLYELLARLYPNESWVFMNYGFKGEETQTRKLELKSSDEPNRYFIQLYDHIIGRRSLEGKRILEVGSGRGGGTSYIKRYHKPDLCIGLDFSKNAVSFCSRTHKVDGLSYKVGNAESLPFPTESFDAIVNVESSHCYTAREKFFNEVQRVLKTYGFFFFADVVDRERLDDLKKEIRSTRLHLVKEEDISAGVLSALEEDGERRYKFFKRTMHPFVLRYFKEFAGDSSSKMYDKISNGSTIYYHYVLQKT